MLFRVKARDISKKSGRVVIALLKRQNTKAAQAGAKGNTTFLLLGSLQNIL